MTRHKRLDASLLDELWARLGTMFGHAWTSQYGERPDGIAGDTWSATLAGITREELAQGLRGTRRLGRDWPPSAPRFRALCLGIPSLAAVQQEMGHGRERSPFTRLVWSYLDSYRFARAEADVADRMIQDAYDLAMAHVMDGGSMLPEPAAAIEHVEPERKPASPDVAAAHLAELKQRFGLSDPEAAEMASGE